MLDLRQTGSLHCKKSLSIFPFYSVRKEDNLQTGEGKGWEMPKYTAVRSLVLYNYSILSAVHVIDRNNSSRVHVQYSPAFVKPDLI